MPTKSRPYEAEPLKVHVGGRRRNPEPRLPIYPLLIVTGKTNHIQQARVLRIHPRQLHRWLHYGIAVTNADELAIRIGLHPSEVWEDWYGDDELLDETG